jgi:hypothetical protein
MNSAYGYYELACHNADLPLIAENYQEAGHCQLRNRIYNRIISIIISEEKVLLGEADRFYEEQEFIGHAGVVYRYLFSGWWVGVAFYIQSGARLVSNDQQAFMESSFLGFWAGLDDSLSYDGNCGVACLAEKR